MNKKTFLQSTVRRGFTLIECILAAAVVVVVLIAIMTFHYYTVTSAEFAEDQLLAARSAYLLSEAWRGAYAEADFDPTVQGFENDFEVEAIQSSYLLDSAPADSKTVEVAALPGVTPLGSYHIRVDQEDFYAKLFYGNDAVSNLRSTHILIVWQDHRGVRHEYYLPTFSQA